MQKTQNLRVRSRYQQAVVGSFVVCSTDVEFCLCERLLGTATAVHDRRHLRLLVNK